MKVITKLALSPFVLLFVFAFSAGGQTTRPKDTSPHTSGFVTANGIKLHYLDWGGTGETLLFIPGGGDNAHAFDEMAPKFADKFRVLALTRRGSGESDKPETGYDVATLTEDVRQFLDLMKIEKVNLIGHSAGGNELLGFGSKYPKRTLKLVFLDAAYDRREVPELEAKSPIPEPVKEPTTLREKIGAEARKQMALYEPPYKKIKAPALSYYAIFEEHFAVTPKTDEGTKKKAQEFIENVAQPFQFRNAERFRKEVAKGEVVVLRGTHHYFYQDSKQKDAVVAKIRTFLLDQN